MPTADYDDEQDEFSQEEQDWFRQNQIAKARQEAARASLPPIGSDIKDHDNARKAQQARDRAAVRAAAITPQSLTGEVVNDPFAFPEATPSVPQPGVSAIVTPTATVATVSAPTPGPSPIFEISFWKAAVNSNPGTNMIGTMLIAPTWEELKIKLKDYPGNWQATEHKFRNTPANLLGFFVQDQYHAPENSSKRVYEVIVSNGKVFKEE